MKDNTSCECCSNYIYDDEYECYVCQANLDEDDMGRFLGRAVNNCPYYQFNDEYKIVKKQM